MSRIVALAAAVVVFGFPASAGATDYAATARSIVPSGQLGGLPVLSDAGVQAQMYDALTPLFDHVTVADLQADFKSEGFGVGPDGPATPERVPRSGVTIVRDRFHVPHITGATRDDVTWAMGWITQEDRALLLAQARYPGRLAALDAPNIDAFGLVQKLATFTPSKQADRLIERTALTNLRRRGAAGKAVLHDIDVYLQGLNARLHADKSSQKPWTRVDVIGANALVGQIFGQGGGDEARRSELLSTLRTSLGAAKANKVWNDVTEFNDPDSPVTIDKSFPYGQNKSSAGNVVLDAGSFKPSGVENLAKTSGVPRWASNFLMVSGRRSTNGHPLFVAGPQIGYFYPGLTLEADVKGPGFEARGATVPGFPGTFVIGRGPDYAWSLTSAGSDTIDTYAETLCGGSGTKYVYKGRCRTMGRVDAGTLKGSGKVSFRTTVHGPVTGYAKVNGRTVALSRKRSSYGQDVQWQTMFRDLTVNKVHDTKSFFRAAQDSPFTFNVAYADDRDIAMFSAGKLPLRDPRVDPRLPTKGTGGYEWRGFARPSQHPQQVNPASGVLVNWNNRPAKGFGAADDNWTYGSLQRVKLLQAGLAAKPSHDLPSVVSAMNAAATQDLRNVALTPTLVTLLKRAPAPSPRAQRMLDLLAGWLATGSSRLDRDLDGVMDAGAAPAIMDAVYQPLYRAAMSGALKPGILDAMSPIIGSEGGSAGDFVDGGFWYLDKDLRTLAGTSFAQPLRTRYCGAGSAAACATALWGAFEAAGAALQAAQGTPDPDAWRADAGKERISFAPGLLKTTIRFTNRSSGIQQVITFGGHRPR